ncbi:MAG: MarC family protein [Acetobacteraceae bacterium]
MTAATLPRDALDTLLLVYPALFSIVNPIAGAFIFNEAATGTDRATVRRLARRVATYSLAVMLVATWGGSFILGVFGISLAAVRIAGGLVLSLWAFTLLSAPERREERKRDEAGFRAIGDDAAFFPLTLPFTTGPGTIAVCIALGATRPAGMAGLLPFAIGTTAACVAMALTILAAYAYAPEIARRLGPAGSRVLTRLAAFLLLAVGVQILIVGVTDVLTPILSPRG